MASSTITSAEHPEQSRQLQTKADRTQPVGGLRFDWLMSLVGFIFVAGVFVDGWAHAHGKVDNTFFTPWHAILYSGYAINALLLVSALFINHRRGSDWLDAMPNGYGLSLLGVPLFAVGGVGDLIWHTLFGFEVGIEQVLSPTHLLLATSGIMIITGPLRATLRRADARGWSKLLPTLLSLIAMLLLFSFFTEYANPFVRAGMLTSPFGKSGSAESIGVAGILLQSGILIGLVLFMLRRWTLPTGSLTLLFTLDIALMSVLADQYRLIPAVLLAGIFADLLYRWLKPSVQRHDQLRIFAFLTPFVLFLCYFADLLTKHGTLAWSVHLWLGSCFMAGIVGLVLSYLVVPPRGPAHTAE